MTTTTVSISGMTCGHCVDAVTSELQSLEGVQGVEIDLNKKGISTATVTSAGPLAPASIGEAVAEAGYLVVSNDA
ncbi:heavy-metal-associated domain-containing protein [Arthrobacter zhaoguopingii]|uniref:heavy-metal-associated domain-containing protein n=1 Tax=Arthrobacter zhaoguopingii TaxID=2681491 RepID=UPI0013580E4B|nr:heavy-metal-associated domain-containing protein [Arthrobacter zhaoguopingii]